MKESRFFYGYIIVIASFFALLVASGTFSSFGVFFKPVLNQFGWTRAETSGAYSLNMILQGFLTVIVGRLSDRLGPRILVTASGLFLGMGYLLMSQVSAIWQLYLFYGVLLGIGSTIFLPLISIVVRWFVKRRGLMTGITLSGVGAGIAIVPPLADRLISRYDWSTSYIILGSVSLIVIVIAAQFLRRNPTEVGQLPDGADQLEVESLDLSFPGYSLQKAIRTRQFWILSLLFFALFFGVSTTLVHIVPHATDLGIPPASAASILAIIGGLSIVGRIGLGSTGDRIGNKPALIISLILVSVALFWLQLAREPWMFYLFAAIFGFGYGGSTALQSPTVADSFGMISYGAILGTVVFSGMIGGAIGPLLTGRIFDMTGSYQVGFLVSAGLSVVGIIAASLSRPAFKEGTVKA